MASLPELARVPSDLATLTVRAVVWPFAVLAELRRLNRTLGEVALIRTDLGPHLEHLPNLEALQGIKKSLDRLSQPGGALDRLADISETLDRLAELDQSLRRLGALEETLAEIAQITEHLPPLVDATNTLPELPAQIAELQRVVSGLGEALEPIGRLAGRMPGARSR